MHYRSCFNIVTLMHIIDVKCTAPIHYIQSSASFKFKCNESKTERLDKRNFVVDVLRRRSQIFSRNNILFEHQIEISNVSTKCSKARDNSCPCNNIVTYYMFCAVVRERKMEKSSISKNKSYITCSQHSVARAIRK